MSLFSVVLFLAIQIVCLNVKESQVGIRFSLLISIKKKLMTSPTKSRTDLDCTAHHRKHVVLYKCHHMGQELRDKVKDVGFAPLDRAVGFAPLDRSEISLGDWE